MESFGSLPSSSSSSATEKPMLSFSASSSSTVVVDDDFENACSICLEPFTSQDPATVTNCKHEYHLQCILDWCQRSKECPICWQSISLKVPASQELFDAIETERNLRSKNPIPAASTHIPHLHEVYNEEQDSYSDNADFDVRITRHLAAAASRISFRRERQRSSGFGPSEFLVFTSPTNVSSVQQAIVQQANTSPGEGQTLCVESSGDNAPTPVRGSIANHQFSPSVTSDAETLSIDRCRFTRPLLRQSLIDGSRGSDFSAFSESIKSKWSMASARCMETISKSTRDIKEKLLARNNSVKELSREVQREMSAGVARMIERLDLASRSGPSSPVHGATGGFSNFLKGKGVQDSV